MAFGLTTDGFVVKTLPDIISDIEDQELDLISSSLDVQPTSLIGVLNGIYAQGIYELWQLVGALYNGIDPDQAVGDQLDSLALITGVTREPATSTVAACTVNVNAGFHAEPGTMFAYVVGNPDNLFYSLDVVDNPAGIAANIAVDFICQDTGPVQALAGTLTQISAPLSGWNTITNAADGLSGSNIEVDSALRIRRNAELANAGSTTADAIRADVLQKMQPPTTSVATTACTVLYNDTDSTDGNGLPPHSIEVVTRAVGATGDDDTALAELIYLDKAAGDGTHGTTATTITDSQGNSVTINHTRAASTALTVVITVLTDPLLPTPSSGDIKTVLKAYADSAYQPGSTVYYRRLGDAVFSVPGVLDYSSYTLNAGTANVTIDVRHIATLSTGSITVTIT